MQGYRASTVGVFIIPLVLLLSSYAVAGQRETVEVEEGQFVFDTSVTREDSSTLWLKGTVLNNTSRDWDVVHFGVRLFNRAGKEIKQCYYLDESYPLFVKNLKRGRATPISERLTLLDMRSGQYGNIPSDTVSRYELCFVGGDYATLREKLMVLGLVAVVLLSTGFLVVDAMRSGELRRWREARRKFREAVQRVRTDRERQGSDTPMGRRQLLGVLGSTLLFLGVFAPIINLPVVGSMNYFYNGKGDGTIILVLAALSFVLALAKKYSWLWVTGLGSLGLLAFTFYTFQQRLSSMRLLMDVELADNPFRGLADLAMESVQLQWGWALLVVGAILVVAAAATKESLSTGTL